MPEPEIQDPPRKYLVFAGMESMDTQSARQGLRPDRAAWMENLQPISANALTTVPGLGATLATLGVNVARMFFASFTASGGFDSNDIRDWLIVFGADGSGNALQLSNGQITNFAPAGTFTTTPDCTQWKSERVLITDLIAGYCTYDNFTFVKQGSVSPNLVITNGGSGYSSTPSVSITGGTGSGATASAIVLGGVVVKLILTAPGSGYLASDTLTLTISAPVSGTTATGTAIVWPFLGAAGTTLSSQINVTNGGHYYTTAPSVTINGPHGTGQTAHANISNGAVVSITLDNPGTGWLPGDTPTVTIAAPPASQQAAATAFITSVSTGGVTFIINFSNHGYGYLSQPSVNVTGGSGTGAFAVINSFSGSVVNTFTLVVPPSGGYQAGDTLNINFSAPPAAVTATATASVITSKGSTVTLAVYQGRVWIGGQRLIQFTGTLGYDNFNPSNAAGSFTITDADLVHSVTALRTFNNYLYIFGDNSVKQIGTISVSGSTTNFSVVTLTSDQGTTFQAAILSYNRFVVFANPSGVWAIYGASVEKISGPMDGVFGTITFGLDIQAAVADINNIRCLLLKVTAPNSTGLIGTLFLAFFDRKWFVISGTHDELAIATVRSGNTASAYQARGGAIAQMLSNPATPVNIVLQTALTDDRRPYQGKRALRFGIAQECSTAANPTMTLLTEGEQNNSSRTYVLPIGFFWADGQAGASGLMLGATLSGTVAGLRINNIILEYQDAALLRSKNVK